MMQDLDRYLRLRYPVEIVQAEEGGYFAHIPDLPGCMAQGETIEEAMRSLEDAKRAWIEVRLEDGLEVPAPHEPVEEYSGRFLMRVPKSLHRELAMRARREATSLNQYVLHLLSLGLGREQEVKQFADLLTKKEGQQVGLLELDALFGNVTTSVAEWVTQSPSPPRFRWSLDPSAQRIWVKYLLGGKQEESLEEEKDRPRELTDFVPPRWRR
jgi:antitoxin HicB